MSSKVLLITPPFTQLNTPYPATAYLKGFLNTKCIPSFQSDLGIEVILQIFSTQGLQHAFQQIDLDHTDLSENAHRISSLRESYLECIDDVIRFLQGKNNLLARKICTRNYLPEASRFAQTDDLHWAFGNMGLHDKAKHLATLFLEDLSDLIQETIDPHFGFSRYAEHLGRSANSFDELYHELQQDPSFTDEIMLKLLHQQIQHQQPSLVAFSVPFPGNLYTAFRCAQYIRSHFPNLPVVIGGGFPNTELRSLSDPRVFEFFHFITLDDGEAPIEQLIKHLQGELPAQQLKRTFMLEEGQVVYQNGSLIRDYKQSETGTPDYSDLLLKDYIHAIEIANPMHSLWSDGQWNKLTMAHGCYWGKCTFCDISLDYIQRYEPVAANLLCDRMETIIAQTGHNHFHFVDEAAPPSLMKALALEILQRKLQVSWWTNIRFEKSFTRDLCQLLKASGCIAVSGGLEVASDRLLALIDKGITVSQVAEVTKYFTEASIMVHAYLMYGFPTQTAQETIDSLEMVRQLFKAGVLQSAFWHLFTMTAHSPVGLAPEKYKVKNLNPTIGTFANNDLPHTDPTGGDHERFGPGLKKSLFNYMQGLGLDEPLSTWFDFSIPKTSIAKEHILNILQEEKLAQYKPNSRVIWIGKVLQHESFVQSKKGRQREMMKIKLASLQKTTEISLPAEQGIWLLKIFNTLSDFQTPITMQQLQEDYTQSGLDDFEIFWDNKPMNTLYKTGLLVV
ncbi:MAG: radical SAM protein [Chitinophagaceae bacterium]|nr:radical SAM protein [Chitinophagaceae bacterium]